MVAVNVFDYFASAGNPGSDSRMRWEKSGASSAARTASVMRER